MYVGSDLNTVSSWYAQQKGNNRKTPASAEKTFYTAETPKVYQIFTTDNMLWTGGNGTGLSYCLKYADDSTDENPVVLAKGVDENGKEFEQRIYINDVNPSSATVVEMRALEAHYKVQKQGGFTSLPLEAGNMGLNDRRDFISMFKESIEDLNKLGRFDLSLLWTKSMDTYLDLTNVQEIYEALKYNVSCRVDEQGQDEIAEKEIQNDESEINNDSSEKMTVWYQGVPLEEWALTDPKYTDSETGISWYIRDGKYPYMVGEDAEKFRKLCEESGEFALKKFAEMTGLIQKLDDNTVAYVGDNGIAVKSKDGKEMFVDTSGLSYDIVMDMFRNLPRNGNFFSNKYWSDNIQKAQA